MRRLLSLVSLLALTAPLVLVTGCIVVNKNPNPGPVTPTCGVPAPATYTQNFSLFQVLGNAATAIPVGDRGYTVTTNGNGTYRLTWTDTAGYSSCFSGRITAQDPFSTTQVTGLTGYETIQLISPNQIGFASVPGATVDGVDFFATRDPIYVDVYADASPAVNIYYTDAGTGLVTAADANPAAFSSP